METTTPRVTLTGSDDAEATGSNMRTDTTSAHMGGDIVAAIGEMVDKLDKVSVNTARPAYNVKMHLEQSSTSWSVLLYLLTQTQIRNLFLQLMHRGRQ